MKAKKFALNERLVYMYLRVTPGFNSIFKQNKWENSMKFRINRNTVKPRFKGPLFKGQISADQFSLK